MVPKPFFETEFRHAASSFSSVDNDDGKVKQRVLSLYGMGKKIDGKMPRKRIGEGLFIPLQGLVGHDFYHMTDEDAIESELTDRAVLLQSIQNYRTIALAGFQNFPENDLDAMQDPRFGEQVIVDADFDICIGDVYEVTGSSTLQLRVTSPRKPSRCLDSKNKTSIGPNGIAHYTTSTALCGWFCEVLCEGTMGEGSELVLMERPEPHWTLPELAKAVYGGEGDPATFPRRQASWGRSQKELEHLISLPYLGEVGWKQKLVKVQRILEEKKLPIPYFAGLAEDNKVVASVLGLYGRGEDLDDYMPRSHVPEATFVPVLGIEGHEFWHVYNNEDDDESSEDDDDAKDEADFRALKKKQRAVLLQSIQNYRLIMKESKFPYFPDKDMEVLVDPLFGEQIILDIPIDICLGDVFTATGSTLKLRVTSPRKPCLELDNRNDTPYGSKGIRHFTCSAGLAGWFCEVVTEGKLVKGSTFELTERPYPQWTMQELSMAIYGGEGDPKALIRGAGSWGRPIEQLHELIANPYLAEVEWKDELNAVLKRMERKKKKDTKVASTSSTTNSVVSHRRRHLSLLKSNSRWIPLLFAFIIATISCSMVMAAENAEKEEEL
mmetsp:Transcript_5641/g.9343  ORF Transcript_5641/g.9343 Transcript_5641/m.9343 type:complete len:607 (-) Transcript_5641:137-1957(-)